MTDRPLFLREWRESRLMTQAELAAKAGVSRDTVVKIETGKQDARFATVRKLAAALGIEPKSLYQQPAE
jgi:DNA-binding XRE family transcriptional regulator